jgi:hypothetical protein
MRVRLHPTSPVALLCAAMSLISPFSLCASNCTNPVEATSTPAWRNITPPKEDVEVVYNAPYGWVGLNHIYAVHQALKHRRRSLIPWTLPAESPYSMLITRTRPHILRIRVPRRFILYISD